MTVSNNPNNDTIELTLTPKNGQSGSANFVSSGTNTLNITQSSEVEIIGVSESNTKDSMRMKAMYQGSGNPVTLDSEDFTVIQATLSIKTTNNVSTDNSVNATFWLGTTSLGGPSISSGWAADLMRHYIEIKAAILPINFDQELTLRREIDEFRSYNGSGSTAWLRDIICSDTSENEFLDKTVSPSGNVYDYDAPGFLVPSPDANGTIVRRRVNFRQWLTISQNYGNQGNQTVVMSGDLFWYQRLSVEKVSSTSQVVNSSVSGDNVVGTGSTNLDWDLGGNSLSTLRTGCP